MPAAGAGPLVFGLLQRLVAAGLAERGALLATRTLANFLVGAAISDRGRGFGATGVPGLDTVRVGMAYDEDLAHRIRELLADEAGVTEKAMFGGLAFLVGGNMAVGISNTDELMVRVGPDATDAALSRPHTRLFDMSGRPMKGWVLVAREGMKTKRQLAPWVERGVRFARTLPAKG